MINLYDIEAISPGHIDTRLTSLTRMRDKLIADGYDVKPISMKNLECFWLTVEHEGVIFNVEDITDIRYYVERINESSN